jgi:phosphoribosylamine--glycine ligase
MPLSFNMHINQNRDMTVMVIDKGGRAHAISQAYENSARVNSIIVVPGNDLISYHRKKEVLVLSDTTERKISQIIELAKKYKVDLVDVAHSTSLELGLVNRLQQEGINVFGPTMEAARLESDKVFARKFMDRFDIPAPKFDVFDSEEKALEYAKGIYRYDSDKSLYVKAAGLCAGKGVIKIDNFEQAKVAIKKMSTLGNAGNKFLIEEALEGEEFTVTIIADGTNYHLFKTARNEKHLRNYDRGPITRGLGAVSPVLDWDKNSMFIKDFEESVIKKTLLGLQEIGTPFSGILSFVVMASQEHGSLVPKVIECNARWGDPEAQVIIPGIKNDYVDVVQACINQKLDRVKIDEDNLTRVCIVGSSRGYPGDTSQVNGKIIFGIQEIIDNPEVHVFGADVAMSNDHFYAHGGRLIHIMSQGKDIVEAKNNAYGAMSRITVEGNNLHYRIDIGWKDAEIIRMKQI